MNRNAPLTRRTGLTARTGLNRGKPLTRTAGLQATGQAGSPRRSRLRPVSPKRAAENRQRSKLIRQLFPDGLGRCAWPRCPDLADDVHEIISRARTGGLITDPSIYAPLCRAHNELATDDSRNQEGVAAGLVFRSGQLAEARAAGLVAAWRTADGRFITEAGAR